MVSRVSGEECGRSEEKEMSISMKVTVKGKENIEKVKAAGAKVQSALQDDLAYALSFGYDVAYSLCRVRTGYLRSTLRWWIQGLKGVLEATAYYAGFVEFGTRRTPAYPFIRPGSDQAVAQFMEAIRSLPKKVGLE